jgi:hypothetical protein
MEPRCLLAASPVAEPTPAPAEPPPIVMDPPAPQAAQTAEAVATAAIARTRAELATLRATRRAAALERAAASGETWTRAELAAARATGGAAALAARGADYGSAGLLPGDPDPFAILSMVDPATLRAGDILVSTENGATSARIRDVTFSAYSHAALYVGDGKIIDATSAGVQQRDLSALTKPALRVGVIRVSDLSAQQSEVVVKAASRLVGKSYNYFGLIFGGVIELLPAYRFFRLVTGKPLKVSPSSLGPGYFCSELVIKAFEVAKVKIAPESGDTPAGIIDYARTNPTRFQLVGRLATG